MRFQLFSLIALFALLLTLASATPATENARQSAGITMSNLFRPWTWTLPNLTPRELDATAQHVRRHGPHRRAVWHP
ncbi:hypothetical protein C8R45DRAFT_1014880 [Mycena sanguinolenta]|nr:hypothetical protein C8R45DRAFT_1014880 [Mycena sanguinolenta]